MHVESLIVGNIAGFEAMTTRVSDPNIPSLASAPLAKHSSYFGYMIVPKYRNVINCGLAPNPFICKHVRSSASVMQIGCQTGGLYDSLLLSRETSFSETLTEKGKG